MPLPDIDNLYFKKPPVVEVALGVQFEPVAELRAFQIAQYWQSRKGDFPRTEEHPPLPPTFELFPQLRTRQQVYVQIPIAELPPVPRFWMLNTGGTELIQIQQDRFVHNWRKNREDDSYPSYPPIRDAFKRELVEFQNFLHNQGVGDLRVTQCEVTFVDHVECGEYSGPLCQDKFHRILSYVGLL